MAFIDGTKATSAHTFRHNPGGEEWIVTDPTALEAIFTALKASGVDPNNEAAIRYEGKGQ